jgi:tRNA U34 2-thiouridine synthase MnmA/TrmU
MTKSLILLSGGLDSRLASKLLQEQAEVEAVFFLLPFSKDNSKEIKKFCNKNKIKLHIIDLTASKLFQEYMEMLRKPKHPRGTALNPCIDCHIFMFKKAKQLADKLKIEIIATGEVLGERPLSQTKKALLLIDKESGFDILRPLSAKLLPETEYEKKKLIDRKKLLDIQGRQRKRQIELANNYKIDYPNAGGGCLLCEPEYCKKLKLILNNKNLTYNNIKLLSTGRHFSNSEIILGRNYEENDLLEKEQGIKIIPEQPGATALVKNKKLIEEAKKLIRKYSKHKIKEFEIK